MIQEDVEGFRGILEEEERGTRETTTTINPLRALTRQMYIYIYIYIRGGCFLFLALTGGWGGAD